MSTITYHKGSGRNEKAEYHLGEATIPASMVTRMLVNLNGKSGVTLDRLFYQALTKHEGFLEAMEAQELAPVNVVAEFLALKPVKAAPTGKRVSKVEKTAEAFVKGICKRFKGSPEEMVAAFLAAVQAPEFKAEAVDIISGYAETYGKTPGGFVKASARRANPAAQIALAKWREDKKK